MVVLTSSVLSDPALTRPWRDYSKLFKPVLRCRHLSDGSRRRSSHLYNLRHRWSHLANVNEPASGRTRRRWRIGSWRGWLQPRTPPRSVAEHSTTPALSSLPGARRVLGHHRLDLWTRIRRQSERRRRAWEERRGGWTRRRRQEDDSEDLVALIHSIIT